MRAGQCRMGFAANFIRFPTVQNFENPSIDKVTESLKVGTFLRHSVVAFQAARQQSKALYFGGVLSFFLIVTSQRLISELALPPSPKVYQMFVGRRLNLWNLLRHLTDPSPAFYRGHKSIFLCNFRPTPDHLVRRGRFEIYSHLSNLSEIQNIDGWLNLPQPPPVTAPNIEWSNSVRQMTLEEKTLRKGRF